MSTETKPMEASNKPEVRVIKGWAASFEGSDGPWFSVNPKKEMRRDKPATLVIGDDAIPRSKVVELLDRMRRQMNCLVSSDVMDEFIETAKDYGITL